MVKKSHKELLPKINEVKERVKKSKVYQDLCKDNNVDLDIIDLVPMAFADLDVSARTDKGVIYFNYKLLDDDNFLNEDHYMIHELQHVFQQGWGDGPTEGSTIDNYLDNEYEQEGFQTQTKYLSETRGDDVAEKYVDQVLDHHDVPEKEKEKRREDLLNFAVEIAIKKKLAGVFKVPKAWTDAVEEKVLHLYASQVWKKLNELIDEHNLGEKLYNFVNEGDRNKGPLNAFYEKMSMSFDEWKKILSELEITNYDNSVSITPDDGKILPWRGSNNINLIITYFRKTDDKYHITISFPTDEMGAKVRNEALELQGKGIFSGVNNNDTFKEEVEFEGSLNDAAKFINWAGSNINFDSYIPFMKEKIGEMRVLNNAGLTDVLLAIKECKKYTASPAKDYIIQEYFGFDLEYFIRGLNQVSNYLDNIDIDKHYDVIRNDLSNWNDMILVSVHPGDKLKINEGTATGLWNPNNKEIYISFKRLVKDFEDVGSPHRAFLGSVEDAKSTIRHELQHMLQNMLQDIHGLKELSGLPSKKIRDKNVDIHGRPKNQDTRIEHALRDVEFYTDLTDAIQEFKNNAIGLTDDLKNEYIKRFIGESNKLDELIRNKLFDKTPHNLTGLNFVPSKYSPNWFFLELKQKAPAKWKIAVRELMKSI